jgi:phage repressor protein C with HTH and peptisase S24 domain|nr:MAG TPA: Repressor protein CI [Caudoviricetes sp.]
MEKKTGETLKNIRKKYNITGEKMAEILGCSTQFIYAIEKNKNKFPVKKLELIKNIVSEIDYFDLIEAIKFDTEPASLKNEVLKIQSIEEIKQKKIPFYPDIEASAGYGRFNDSEIVEFLEVPEDLARPGNIAIRVAGDSMEPEIKDGDTIVIDTNCIECILNKIIVVNYQGAVYLKKYVEENGKIFLKSINPYYPKIRIGNREELRVIGKLKSVMRYY